MPLHTTPEPLPRRVYFGAADKQHLAKRPLSGGPSQHEIEIGRRSKLAADVTARAEDVAHAIKSLRAFDTTGSTEDALDHLQATIQDLNRAHGILVDHVTEAIGRYRDRRENEQVLAESTTVRVDSVGLVTAGQGLGEVHVDIMPTIPGLQLPTAPVEIAGQFTDEQAAAVAAGNVPGMSIAAVLAEKTPKPGPRMAPAKHRAEVFIQPKNRRPLTRTATLTWSTAAEFRKQLEAYAATVWISARAIFVDTSSKEILVDGTAVANYAVHTPGTPAPQTPAVPTVPIRRASGRAYTRHTLGQIAVVTAGLMLTTTAAGTINGLFLAGFALAGFGLYRLGLGIDRREAIR